MLAHMCATQGPDLVASLTQPIQTKKIPQTFLYQNKSYQEKYK